MDANILQGELFSLRGHSLVLVICTTSLFLSGDAHGELVAAPEPRVLRVDLV